jgi:anhydro-N-acetylmuramic acid kinase
MDMAYGGQGAPLAPIFHQAFLATPGETTAIVNIGGIANVTLLEGSKLLAAFDTGPGNTLMDTWMQTHHQQEYDQNGDLARTGKILPELLTTWLKDPYFEKPFPKSTGREYFSTLPPSYDYEASNMIQTNVNTLTTLTELTAQSISHALAPFKPKQILICGGGAFNTYLIERLQSLNPQAHLGSVAEKGFDPQDIEALAFAYLAKLRFENTALDLRGITGSNSPASLLGVVYSPDSRR